MNDLLTFTTPELTIFFLSLVSSVVMATLYLRCFSKTLIRSFDFQRGFYLFGIVLSLLSSIALLNWESTAKEGYVVFDDEIEDDRIEIPQTFIEKPKPIAPPPPPIPIKKPKDILKITLVDKAVAVSEDPIPQDLVDVPIPPSSAVATPMPPPTPIPVITEDDPEEWVSISEQMPRFPGCMLEDDPDKCTKERIVAYIYSRLKYPPLAREHNAEGMVVIQFKIDKRGQMGEVNIVRDIGFGCGKAAAEVVSSIKELDLWTPGKQRGRPVNILYTMPVKFKLN